MALIERVGIGAMVLVFLLVGSMVIIPGSAVGEPEKPVASGEGSSEMVLVVKGKDNGGESAALRGATVNVSDSSGKQHQQKTTKEGRAVITDLPRGNVRVQVVAAEWEPFGKDYDLTQQKHEFHIEMDKRKSK